MTWYFPVWYFFSVVLSKSMCISVFGPSSSPSNSLVILFIYSAFPLCFFFSFFFFFGYHIFSKIFRFLLHPVVVMFLRHLHPVVGRIFFHCFGMSCSVYIILPFVDISLIFLLLPEFSGLFPQVVLSFFFFFSYCLFYTSWWFPLESWVTASPLKSPGLFIVFWLISIIFTQPLRSGRIWHKVIFLSRVPMVSTPPLISKSTNPCTNPLVTVPNAPITIGITFTFMFHSFYQFSSKVYVLISLLFFQSYPVINRNGKVHYSASSQFLFTITRSGRLVEIRWSVCVSKSQ